MISGLLKVITDQLLINSEGTQKWVNYWSIIQLEESITIAMKERKLLTLYLNIRGYVVATKWMEKCKERKNVQKRSP